MTHYDSTARVPFAKGGKVGQKKSPVKRIILWKGKAKDWPGAKKAAEQTRNRKAEGGEVKEQFNILKKHLGTATKGKTREEIKKAKIESIKRKRVQSQKEYMKKHGKPEGRRKTLAVTDKYKKIRDSLGLKKGGKAKDSVHQPTTHSWWLLNRNKKAKGGKADKNWIQGVNKSIKKRGTKGVCTGKKFGGPTCRPGTKRYNLAKTFKKMARSKHASGGLVRFI